MHGNPIIRVLAVITALAITAVLVRSITRDSAKASKPVPDPSSTSAEAAAPSLLLVQFSAPARSLSIQDPNDKTILVDAHQPASTEEEFSFALPVENKTATLLINLAWESPAPNRFVRLVLEVESLPTKEMTIHCPADLENHAVSFAWSANPDIP